MSPAEFDTKRRMLGLSVDDAAQLCGGVSSRAVNNWMRGEAPIPNDAIQALALLEKQIDNAIDYIVADATDKTESGIVVLLRYRTQQAFEESQHAAQMPFGAHAILIGLTAQALEAEGIEVEIFWAN